MRIDELYAIVAIAEDGDEAVPAFYSPALNMMLPMMGADISRLESLMPVAQGFATRTKTPMKILKFTAREQIGEINPQ